MNFKSKWLWLIFGLLLVLFAVAPVISTYYPPSQASGSNGGTPSVTQTSGPPPSGGGPAVNCANPCTIVIKNSIFGATQPTVVKVGTKITWINQDDTVHTSTSDPGDAISWNSGIIQIGASFSNTFNTAGTFTYHCNVHPMTGSIVVVS